MTRARAIGAVLRELLIGDDPVTAVGVALGLGVTALLAGAGVPAWWVLPVAVVGLLARVLMPRRQNRRDRRQASTVTTTMNANANAPRSSDTVP